jgi:hypothetical protein
VSTLLIFVVGVLGLIFWRQLVAALVGTVLILALLGLIYIVQFIEGGF